VHRAGYALGRDQQFATHMRTRYHIINKLPTNPGPGFEPSLWIVHYGPNDPQYRFPIARIDVPMQVRQIVTERQMIESQGALQRKEFMLHDRANWPTINVGQRPNMPPVAHPGVYAANQMQMQQQMAAARQQRQFYPPQVGIVPPPAKRQRQAGPAALQAAVAAGVPPDTYIEDEENTMLGDYLDHLTPAEISRIRYKQHHEWMEEIFSSVYSISQIVPEELGLGLTGELKTLTDGIFHSPIPQDVLRPTAKEPQTGEVQEIPSRGYQKLTPQKLTEFESRIDKYMENGQAEIEAMKKEHAKVVNDFKRSRTYMISERKLRDAALQQSNETAVDDIVKEAESTLNVTIGSRQNVVTVEKGGLEEEDKSRVNGNAPTAPSGTFNGATNFGDGDNTAANLLDQFGSGSYANTPVARIPTPHTSASASSGAPTPAGATAGPNLSYMHQQSDIPVQDDGVPDESGLDLIDGMDLDVDLEGLEDEVDAAIEKGPGGEEDWVIVPDDNPTATPATAAPAATDSAEVVSQPPTSATAQNGSDASTTAAPSTSAPLADPTPAAESTPGTADLFASGDFDSFDMQDTAGDALADYGGDDDDLGLDLGDNFDEAFDGTGIGEDED
jgi:hypothetical protein